MLTVLLQFLLAHVLGDFVFQTRTLVAKRKEQIRYMGLHIGIHALSLLFVFIADLPRWWAGIAFVLCTHLGIDCLKVWYERKWPSKPFRAFIIDQALHILMIVLIMWYYFPDYFAQLSFFTPTNLLYVLTGLVLVFVTPVVMRIFFSKWDQEQAFTGKKEDTLLDAGLVIGILERVLVVLFIQLNFLAGIGFLIGAKSIFRFGDLTKSKEAKFTEYVLVGTFLSYTIAIVIGVLLKYAIDKQG